MLRYVKPDTMKLILTVTFCGLALLSSAPAQGTQPLAITNARILTMEGATIDSGTVLIRNGKILTVGEEVKIPAGSQVIDAQGGTLMPGLVSAYSRAGLGGSRAAPAQAGSSRRGPPRGFRMSRGRSSGGSGRNSAATKVAHSIYARQDIFHALLEAGVTSLALAPTGTGFPGQGALLDLSGKTRSSLVADDAMFVAVNPANNTKAKKLIKDTFASAKKLIEERNKPAKAPAKAPTKAPVKKPAPKPSPDKAPEKKPEPPKPKPTPKPTPTPKPKPAEVKKPAAAKPAAKPTRKKPVDPTLSVVADLLDGKIRGFLSLNTASDVLHYFDAVGDTRFTSTILAMANNPSRGELVRVADKLKSLKAPILLAPALATKPNTNQLTNPAARLHQAGLKIGFVIQDSPQGVRSLFHNLLTLVRHGLDATTALKAVTIVPAEMLGIDGSKGSIKAGKDADLILWDTDPLSPMAKRLKVFRMGVEVKKVQDQ